MFWTLIGFACFVGLVIFGFGVVTIIGLCRAAANGDRMEGRQ